MGLAYAGGNAAFTPSTTNDNWTLDVSGTTGLVARVLTIGWGGRETASVAYATRWTRPTAAGSGSATAITIATTDPNYNSPLAKLTSTYGTSQPTLAADPAGNLHRQDWNGYGGLGYIVFPIAQPWLVISGVLTSQLSCRNISGTTANVSSYHVEWEE